MKLNLGKLLIVSDNLSWEKFSKINNHLYDLMVLNLLFQFQEIIHIKKILLI